MPMMAGSLGPAVRRTSSPSSAPQRSQMRKLPFWPAQKAENW